MLVVIAIIIALAAIVAGVANSGLAESQKVVSSGDRVSGWLLIAKQRAQRDRAPRGVRFIANAAGQFTEALYIEAPEVYIPNPGQESNPTGGRIVFAYEYAGAPNTTAGNAITTREVYFVVTGPTAADASNALSEFDQRVTAGDSIVLPEFNASYRITAVNTPAPTRALQVDPLPAPAIPVAQIRRLSLQTQPDLSAAGLQAVAGATPKNVTWVSYKYGFQSQAQPYLGEPVMQMTKGTCIDYRAPTTALALGAPVDPQGYRTWASPGPGLTPAPYHPPTTIGVSPGFDGVNTSFDILFSPGGQVLNNASTLACLWVRDPDKGTLPLKHPRQTASTDCDARQAYDDAGEQVLVVIYTRSGLIATHPVDEPPTAPAISYDPYRFAKDGQNSGL